MPEGAMIAVGESAARPDPRSFGIYVHWPFCRSKCPYCDFNSHVREAIDEGAWTRALLQTLDRQAGEIGARRSVGSVFFGGGTPSLMSPRSVGAVLDRIARHWQLGADAEVTLEANPTSVEAEKFLGFGAAGVNRVSLGVQSFDERALHFLGRQHSAGEARAAINLAASHFARFSFDLIYARPGQSVAEWEAELCGALDFATDHLSLYQLTVEPGTAFHAQHARGDFAVPQDGLAADLYEATQAQLEARLMPAYEVSNHARLGAECRHNLLYWRYGDYVGVGPGAHGRLTLGGTKVATRQKKAPESWLADIQAGGDGMEERLEIDPQARLLELVMMGLRLAEGVPRARFLRECGAPPEDLLDAPALARLEGFVVLDQAGLRATKAGRQRLNSVLATLLA
jgi:putative oxygen-independent coproporphyrinogen III oxidase